MAKKLGFPLLAIGAVAAAPLLIKNAKPLAKAVGSALQKLGTDLQDFANEKAVTETQAVRPGPQEVPVPDPKHGDEVPPAPDIPEAPAHPEQPDPHEPQEPQPNPGEDPSRRARKASQSQPAGAKSRPKTVRAKAATKKKSSNSLATPPGP